MRTDGTPRFGQPQLARNSLRVQSITRWIQSEWRRIRSSLRVSYRTRKHHQPNLALSPPITAAIFSARRTKFSQSRTGRGWGLMTTSMTNSRSTSATVRKSTRMRTTMAKWLTGVWSKNLNWDWRLLSKKIMAPLNTMCQPAIPILWC